MCTDVAIVESNVSQKSIESLKKRGHLVVPVDEIARVNAIYCNKGTPGKNVKCILGSDPRGLGITVYSSF